MDTERSRGDKLRLDFARRPDAITKYSVTKSIKYKPSNKLLPEFPLHYLKYFIELYFFSTKLYYFCIELYNDAIRI